tara:strand:- start:55 stop:651 length:597 start_codon:yes stop_codon:yes gene_type:complete
VDSSVDDDVEMAETAGGDEAGGVSIADMGGDSGDAAQRQRVEHDENDATIRRILNAGVDDLWAAVGADRQDSLQAARKMALKLSLTVHPDKCNHPRAEEAQKVVSTALDAFEGQAEMSRHITDRERAKTSAAQAAAQAAAAAGDGRQGDGRDDGGDGAAQVGEKRKKKGKRSKGSGQTHAQSRGVRKRARDGAQGHGD